MADSQPKPSAKKSRMRLVSVLCSACRRSFITKARAHLCPRCRPKPGVPFHLQNNNRPQQQNNNNKPRPQRPKRPNKRPQNSPPQQELVEPMSELNVKALTSRTSQNASLLRPSRGARSAVERLLLQVLDPAASCGQKPILVNVDQIQLPKYPIQFDNNFVVQSPSGNYKIMLVASPIISAVIWSETDGITIQPNRSLMFPSSSGFYYYIINSKVGFLAETDVRFVITSKEDFRRFRMIAASMQSQWSGAELFKNGVAVTARITDKENMAEFDPNSKADNVISNVSDVLVTTCQHSEPVFEFSPVDANNDDGGGNLPDPDKSQYAKYVYEITSRTGGQSIDGLQFGPVAISTTNASTTAQTLAQFADKIQNLMSTNTNTIKTSTEIITALSEKYSNFRTEGMTVSPTTSYSMQAKISVTMLSGLKKLVNTISFNNLTNTTSGDFFRQLVIKAQGLFADDTLPGAISGNATGTINIELQVPIDGKINQRTSIPWPVSSALANNELTSTPFYDDNFLQPVTQIMGSGEFPITMQYQTSHSFEFVLGDTTVLATAAVANTPKDPESVVQRGAFNRIQKIMKGLPPAHVMSSAGMTRTTMAQFASRGIINDIFSLAAPIAGALFPGIRPILNAAKPLVSVVDGMV